MRRWSLRFSATSLAVCASIGASTAVHAQGAQPNSPSQSRVAGAFSWFAESDARYISWQGTRGTNVWAPEPGKGSQFYTPITLGMDYRQPELYKFETRVKGGWTDTDSKTVGQQANVSTWLDTQVTTTWTYLASQNFRTFVGLATNLPTGKSYFPNNERFVRMDPDLIEVSVAGAGWNFNPTAGFIFALTENTAVSLSAGYAWLGQFTREGFAGGAGSTKSTIRLSIRREESCLRRSRS